jgi:hypothetical protein
MSILVYLGLLLLGVLLSRSLKPGPAFMSCLAAALFAVNCIIAIGSWVYYFGGIRNGTVLHVFTLGLSWMHWISYPVYGYTHWRNGDPFSDSYAAVIQLITLSLLLTLFFREPPRTQDQSNANGGCIKSGQRAQCLKV